MQKVERTLNNTHATTKRRNQQWLPQQPSEGEREQVAKWPVEWGENNELVAVVSLYCGRVQSPINVIQKVERTLNNTHTKTQKRRNQQWLPQQPSEGEREQVAKSRVKWGENNELVAVVSLCCGRVQSPNDVIQKVKKTLNNTHTTKQYLPNNAGYPQHPVSLKLTHPFTLGNFNPDFSKISSEFEPM